jgi:maltooligosyltrehalose trehalohydrolase
MRELRVWAPNSQSVEIEWAATRIPMQPGAFGWWSAKASDGSVDYRFILDGGEPLPDPRSPWQPAGVHGPSRTVEHSSFEWNDGAWRAPPLGSAIVYELHIGTFTAEGTFQAAIERIPHLKELGVTHVELMPVAEFPGDRGWGYDGVDLYAPHHAYGGPEGLKRLVDALHSQGLAAVLDVVYNHLGPSGNYLSRYGPYFTGKVQTPWGDAVNLSGPGSDAVRSFFIENALMWLREYHFDGVRLDAVHALTDGSAVHFLEELTNCVKRLELEIGRPLSVIAESDLNDPRLITEVERGGYGLSAQWSDDFHHALHTVLTGECTGYYADFGSLRHLAKAIEDGYVYDGQYSLFRQRRHGHGLDRALKLRLLGYLQNHDQIGNRARGERISALASIERVKIGAALVLLGPFIPLLFQGEEWGASTPFQYFTSHTEPELGRAVSEGRRGEFAAFGWAADDIPDPQDPETFRRSKLNWQEIHRPPQRDLLRWYRELIAVRKAHLELTSPETAVVFSQDDNFLIMERPGVSVVCNLGRAEIRLRQRAGAKMLLGSSDKIRSETDHMALAPGSVAIMSGRLSSEMPGFTLEKFVVEF